MQNRIYISSDIEGTCGICHWDETELDKRDYPQFRAQMTREVSAAITGARAGGADDIFVKDAHDSARNLTAMDLPEGITLFRGWGSDIHSMVSGIDASFTAALFTGYHSSSNTDASPLCHTMNTQNSSVRINGMQTSEMLMNLYSCALYDVPVVLVTGDSGVCEQARRMNPNIHTVAVHQGRGDGVVAMHPAEAVRKIEKEAELAVREAIEHPERFKVDLPSHFDVEIEYKHHARARRSSFYPGARQTGPRTVLFSTDAYYDALRFLMFCL